MCEGIMRLVDNLNWAPTERIYRDDWRWRYDMNGAGAYRGIHGRFALRWALEPLTRQHPVRGRVVARAAESSSAHLPL